MVKSEVMLAAHGDKLTQSTLQGTRWCAADALSGPVDPRYIAENY